MNIEQELHKHLFQQREEQTQHLEYNLEFQFYNAVASGDMETVSRYCTAEQDETVYDGTEYGRLSENRLQNARYHFVVAVALITRVCVEQGMERETAYTLSDVLIQRMDRLTTVSEISALHNAMIRDFTRRMQEVRRAHAYSIHVSKAISYISAHLHEKLTTQDIADAISLNRSYLSTLFRREIGKTLHQYLLRQASIRCPASDHLGNIPVGNRGVLRLCLPEPLHPVLPAGNRSHSHGIPPEVLPAKRSVGQQKRLTPFATCQPFFNAICMVNRIG